MILLFCFLFTSLFGQGVNDAGTYHKNSAQQQHLAEHIMARIPWEGSEWVLDVGCGDGKITAQIAAKVPSGGAIGMDISPSMVSFAKANYPLPNLDFIEGDAATLSFDRQFDVVVSFSTLHWVRDQAGALQGIARALKPGGKAYLQTYGKAPMNVVAVCEKLIYSEEWQEHFPAYQPQRVYFTPGEYQDLLSVAGFQEAALQSYWYEYTLPDREAAYKYTRPLMPFINHLSQEEQRQFVNEFLDEFIKLAKPTEDGSIIFRYLILEVVASTGEN